MALLGTPVLAQGQNAVVKLGMDRGGLVLGGEYALEESANESVLGYASMHSKSDKDGAPGLTSLGAAVRISHSFGPYEVFLSPGGGLINYDSASAGVDSGMLLGPRLSYGLYGELDRNIHLGFENLKLYSWFGEVEGLVSDTFLLNGKFEF